MPYEPEFGDRPFTWLNSLLKLPPADPRLAWLESVWKTICELEDAGYTWEWVNDESVAEAKIENDGISIRGNSYKAILILDAPWIQPEAAINLKNLMNSGAAVFIKGNLPSKQPGYFNYVLGDATVSKAMNEIRKRNRNSDQPVQLLKNAGITGVVSYQKLTGTIRYISRNTGDGRIIFFRNPADDVSSLSLQVNGGCSVAKWYDPWNNAVYKAEIDGAGGIEKTFNKYESAFLFCGNMFASLPESEPAPEKLITQYQVKKIDLTGPWTLDVKGDDVPGGVIHFDNFVLEDWREVKQLKYCSSPGIYRNNFSLSKEVGDQVFIDLGFIVGAAEISINGVKVNTLIAYPFIADITPYVKEENEIEIKLISALRNRYVGYGVKGEKMYKQFAKKENTLIPGGLTDQVRLIKIERKSQE